MKGAAGLTRRPPHSPKVCAACGIHALCDAISDGGVTRRTLEAFTRDTRLIGVLFALDAAVPGFVLLVEDVPACGPMTRVQLKLVGLRRTARGAELVNRKVVVSVEVNAEGLIGRDWPVDPLAWLR